MTTSLRDELADGPAQPLPDFDVLLPSGWTSVVPSRSSLDALSERVSDVFRGAHRPDLDARFRLMMRRAAADLLSKDPVRMMYPADVEPEDMFPLSIVVTRLTGPGGGSLDEKAREVVRSAGAQPFDDAGSILRWHSDGAVSVDGGTATVRSFCYLVAIPGTERRQALLFSGVIPTAADGQELEEDTLTGAQLLMDAIMSTFAWRS